MNQVISYYNLELDTNAIKLCKKIEKTIKNCDNTSLLFIEKYKNVEKQLCSLKETISFYIFLEIFNEFLERPNDLSYEVRIINEDDIMRSIKSNKDLFMFLRSLRKNKKETKSPCVIGKAKKYNNKSNKHIVKNIVKNIGSVENTKSI